LDKFSVNNLELTISANDLLNCWANLHLFENLERKIIIDCENNTKVIESIRNKDLGKCFPIFPLIENQLFY
jgi:hypothetical protein